MKTDLFPFGATYAPVAKATEVPMSEWDADLRRMREQGFTLFRSFVAWDRIEQKEGERNFEMLDYVFTLAEKHGLKITLNIGGVFDNLVSIYPPQWLHKNYDCHLQMNHHSNPEKWIGTYKRICIHDKIYKEKAEDFLKEVITRYAGSPVLHSWVVWNEPLYRECFCEETLRCFREWLKAKYGNIEELNKTWSTEYPINYADFSEADPPTGAGFLGGGYAPWLDWREFGEDTISGAMQWVTDLVEKYDPGHTHHPTTTNVVCILVNSDTVNSHINGWKMGAAVGRIGLSQYTLRNYRPWYSAAVLDRIRAASADPEKKFNVIECEAGPVLWVHNGLPGYSDIRKRLINNWQMVGKGAKMILSWLYRTRTTDAQAGEFGMVGWDGEPTERSLAAGKMSSLMQKHAGLFDTLCVPAARVAVLTDQSTLRLGAAEGYEGVADERKNYWERSWQGAYKMFWDNNIPVDFIQDADVHAGKLADYRVLVLPFRQNMEPESADRIKEFVENGGYALADFPLGMKNNRGILNYRAPGCGLDEVFGCSYNDALPVQSGSIALDNGTIKNHVFQLQLSVPGDAEVIGTREGSPAVIVNNHGKGKTLFAGTMLFADYMDNDDQTAAELILRFIGEAGVKSRFRLNGLSVESARNIEICELGGKDSSLLVINNYNKEQAAFTLESETAFKGDVTDILNGTAPEHTDKTIKIDVPSFKTAVIRLDR